MIPVSFTVDKLTCAGTGTNWSVRHTDGPATCRRRPVIRPSSQTISPSCVLSSIPMAAPPSCLRKEAGKISRPVGLLSVSHPYQLSDHIIEMIDAL